MAEEDPTDPERDELRSGPTEIFELEVLGGAIERRFRRLRPHAAAMPWSTLDLGAFSPEEVFAAQRGWTDLAVQEYGAAASQANALRLVIKARAPLDLTALVASFPLDELAHTDICARMIAELGGAVPLEYTTNEVFPEPASEGGATLLLAARAVAWEFCVGETLSLGHLKFHRNAAELPLLKAVWGRLERDEALHARFGWLFLDWAYPLLSHAERGELEREAERAIAHVDTLIEKVERQPDPSFSPVGVFGSRGKAAYIEETRAVLNDQVVARLRNFMA